MIDASEHFYHDDPNHGPRDVATRLRNVNYFFLGNGLIQAAVQDSPEGDGTPLGLLVMDPDRLRQKRAGLTMNARDGLAATLLQLVIRDAAHTVRAGECVVNWEKKSAVPTVRAVWNAGGCRIMERFLCPDLSSPRLVRQITIKNNTGRRIVAVVSTGVKRRKLRRRIVLPPRGRWQACIAYHLDAKADRVRCAWERHANIAADARTFWTNLSRVSYGNPQLEHSFDACRRQLPAAVSRTGRVDGGIWQYNLEWIRDQAVIAHALTILGATGPATTMFARMLDKFVTPEGDTLDSSTKRNPAEVELDQNGYLLCALRDYVLWTGNLDLVRSRWEKVTAVAEFPLQPVFRHPESGLLMNCREIWERHAIHGIEPGMEMCYQLYVIEGLAAAAMLARMVGETAQSERWTGESARLRHAFLEDPRFRMHDRRGFIKRRAPDGSVQETVTAGDAGLPASVPLMSPGPHLLNPDTSTAMAVALGTVAPDSSVARRTLRNLEKLWNQTGTGGYSRYHCTSEPDSPGGWPFASVFVARAALEMGEDDKMWRVLNWLDSVTGSKAGTWFEFYGERISPPLPQVGIVVWTWAELVVLHTHHILGIRPEENGVLVRPRLPSGIDKADAIFTVRGKRLRLRVTRSGRRVSVALRGARASQPGEWRLDY